MADKNATLAKLESSLTDAIDNWLEDNGDERADLGWVGDGTSRLMAKAAMAAFESTLDVQDYLRREGMLKD